MTNIEKQISKGINEFQIGNIVTRIYPAKIPFDPFDIRYRNLDENDSIYDTQGIGTPYKLVKILEEKDKIYLKNLGWKSDNIIELKYSLYKDGWAKYVDPKGGNIPLLNKEDGMKIIKELNIN